MRRRASVVAVLAALVAVLVGCTSIPSSGGVNQVTAHNQQAGGTTVFVPSGPTVGQSPEDLVNGFVAAAAGPKNHYAVAREFLTSGFASKWRPTTGVLLHEAPVSIMATTHGNAGTAVLSVPVVARLDADGVLTSTASPRTVRIAFGLQRVAGAWRISSASQDGTVLLESTFVQLFASDPLSFFDPTYANPVPDLRWFLRAQPDELDAVVRALVAGPRGVLAAPVAATAFPTGTTVVSARTDSTTVSVDLRFPSTPSSTALARMRAQIAATVPNTTVVVLNGVARAVAPAATRSGAPDQRALVLRKGRFGYESPSPGGAFTPSPLEKQVVAADPLAIAYSSITESAAVQNASGIELVTKSGTRSLDTRADVLAPSIDPRGLVWSMSASDPSTVRIYDQRGDLHTLSTGITGNVTAFEVSPDGTRLLVLPSGGAGVAEIYGIVRGSDGVPTTLTSSPTLVEVGGSGAIDATWENAGTVATLGSVAGNDGGAQIVEQAVGGIAGTPLRLSDAVQIVGDLSASSHGFLVRLSTGQVWTAPRAILVPSTLNADLLATQR